MIKVLYVLGVGSSGGSSKSLFEAISIQQLDIDIHVLAPKGNVIQMFSKVTNNVISAKGISRFDNTKYSHYKGIRWILLLREILKIPSTFIALLKAKKKWKDFDIIHFNEITEIIPLLICTFLFKSKIVVHVRSIFNKDEKSFRYIILSKILNKYADLLIPIDKNVLMTLPNHPNKRVINNSYSRNEKLIKNSSKTLRFGYLGTLSKMKGIDNLLIACELLNSHDKNFKILIAGDSIRSINFFLRKMLSFFGLVNSKSLNDYLKEVKLKRLDTKIKFIGNLKRIDEFFASIDVLIFPTYLDAPGRPVIEAASYSIPSIVSVSNPQDDTIINYETGIAIKSNTPQEIMKAMQYFLQNPKSIPIMGLNAEKLYKKNFTSKANSEKLITLYKEILNIRLL